MLQAIAVGVRGGTVATRRLGGGAREEQDDQCCQGPALLLALSPHLRTGAATAQTRQPFSFAFPLNADSWADGSFLLCHWLAVGGASASIVTISS